MPRRSKKHNCEAELGQVLEMLHCLTSARVFHALSRSMHSTDLSFSQFTALFTLVRFGRQSIAELAEGVHLSHAAASRMVEKLVREGLVRRETNPDDRRQKRVELSRKGTGYIADLRSFTEGAYVELLADAPEKLRDELRSVLIEVKAYLPSENGCG